MNVLRALVLVYIVFKMMEFDLFEIFFKGVVPSNFPRRAWIVDSMGDTLVFTGTKTIKYFSRYGLLFGLTLKINFPKNLDVS